MANMADFSFSGSGIVPVDTHDFDFDVKPAVTPPSPAQDTPLLFQSSDPGSDAWTDLIFGKEDHTVIPTVEIAVATNLPGLKLSAKLGIPVVGRIDASFPAITVNSFMAMTVVQEVIAGLPDITVGVSMVGSIPIHVVVAKLPDMVATAQIIYETHTDRPTVSKCDSAWQDTSYFALTKAQPQQDADVLKRGWNTMQSSAIQHPAYFEDLLPDTMAPEWVNDYHPFSRATASPKPSYSKHEQGTPVFQKRTDNYAPATRNRTGKYGAYQEANRHIRQSRKTWHQLGKILEVQKHSSMQSAHPYEWGRNARFQDAMQPPVGQSFPPGIVVPPVIVPTWGTHLIFGDRLLATTELIFGYVIPGFNPDQISIPVRKVYIIMNEVQLFKIDGNVELPVLSMSLDIDMNSWAWGFSASLPGEALDDVYSTGVGSPIELKALVNGEEFFLLAEKVSRSRSFGRTSVSVSGRGRSAYLANPYSPVGNFTVPVNGATAQALMNSVLMINGVSIGWELDWGITDWFVMEGVWSKSGSYMDAITTIAAAAGAYILPDKKLQKLFIKPQYPVLPWNWATALPDIELPSDIVVTEGVTWEEKPAYNGVYVSGASQGVLGYVKRTGSAGDYLAPMVTDELITHGDVARMRGGTILSDTGKMATISLSLPIMPETGIIQPGKMIRYMDRGTNVLGLVKGVKVSMSSQSSVRQDLEVVTHG